MKKKILKMCALLVVFAMVIFGAWEISNYFAVTYKPFSCNSLTWEKCIKDNRCEPKMSDPCLGSESPNPLCFSENPRFLGCLDKKSEEEIKLEEAGRAKTEQANQLTRETCLSLGAFYDGSSGCFCPNSNTFRNVVHDEQSYLAFLKTGGETKFIADTGCRTDKVLCLAENGTWQENPQPVNIVDLSDKAEYSTREQCSDKTALPFFCDNFLDSAITDSYWCFIRWNDQLNHCEVAQYDRNVCKL